MSRRCSRRSTPKSDGSRRANQAEVLPEGLAKPKTSRYSCCAMSTGFVTRNKVQSLDRALEILKLLGSEPEMRVTDLARRLEVHKSTVVRLLSTLQEQCLVEPSTSTDKYSLRYG